MALTRITKGVIKPNEDYETRNVNATGIITATELDVNGAADISGNTAIGGNLSVQGVLTYEDVTSIDSVGIITAKKDVHVGAGLSVVGLSGRAANLYSVGIYGNTMTTNPRALETAVAVLNNITPQLRNNIVDRGLEFLEKLKRPQNRPEAIFFNDN